MNSGASSHDGHADAQVLVGVPHWLASVHAIVITGRGKSSSGEH